MARNLVLCCDGTSNQFAKDRTNVLKLCHALEKDEAQLVYYHPGIGTRAPTGIGTKVGSRLARIAGLAFGYRLQDDIVDAYRFLMNSYRPGDRVWLFGFSRGAYTARVIASMLKLYGLAGPGNDALVPYAVEMLWAISGITDPKKEAAYFELAADFRATLGARECPVHFLGLWDTVNSVGWVASPLILPYTRNNPSVAIVRHAKAIDERRAFFRVNWFEADPKRDIAEVWFPGEHCDVGGGHPEAESGISKYALKWMADEARSVGLRIDQERLDEMLGLKSARFARASPDAKRHKMPWKWWIGEFVFKPHWNYARGNWEVRMNLFRRRTMPDDAWVHSVAWEIPGYAKRLPEGARPWPLGRPAPE